MNALSTVDTAPDIGFIDAKNSISSPTFTFEIVKDAEVISVQDPAVGVVAIEEEA